MLYIKVVIGIWRKMKQGQGVQRTISALLKPKLNFSMGAKTPCPEGQEHTTIKGHSMLCYGHFMRGQLEIETVSSEGPQSSSLGHFQQWLSRDSEQVNLQSHLKLVATPSPLTECHVLSTV